MSATSYKRALQSVLDAEQTGKIEIQKALDNK